MQGGSVPRAVVLAALLWPACAAGAFLGAALGAALGSAGDEPGGWAALGWGLAGAMLGVAVGAGLLGWIWAVACGRRRLMPPLVVLVLLVLWAIVGLPLLIAAVDSRDPLRIVVCCLLVVLVTGLVYLVGRMAPPRAARPAERA